MQSHATLWDSLAALGFAKGKQIGEGEFGVVYIVAYSGDDPALQALSNKGELVIKIAKEPTYENDSSLNQDEQVKSRKDFNLRLSASKKTNENEFKIISEGLGELSVSTADGFLPKSHAMQIGQHKVIISEYINGTNLENYLRQLGLNETTKFLSMKEVNNSSSEDESNNIISDDEEANQISDDESESSSSNQLYGEPIDKYNVTTILMHILESIETLITKLNLLGFAHNDLSCRNIMVVEQVDGSLELKIYDFGLTLKLNKEGKCIEDPKIEVAPLALYGQLDKSQTKSVLTEGMSLQYTKIEALAIFMGFLALPPKQNECLPNTDTKNVMQHIHSPGLNIIDKKIDPTIPNDKRLQNSVSNLAEVANTLKIDQFSRDPRGVIVEYIIDSMKENLLKTPDMKEAIFRPFSLNTKALSESSGLLLNNFLATTPPRNSNEKVNCPEVSSKKIR